MVQVDISTANDFLKYTAATKTSSLDSTSKALIALSEVFKRDTKLLNILSAPTLSPGDKSQIIQELQRHMGGADKGDIVKNFLKTLADNNRLGILEGVCEKFTTLMSAARGEVELTVTSASVGNSRDPGYKLLIQSSETRPKSTSKAGKRGG